MSEHETMWHLGANDAPLPMLAARSDEQGENLKWYVEQHKQYGPIFRISRPGRNATILAGADANVFMARVGPEVLSEKTFWQDFDTQYAGREVAREGDANRQRRALLSRSYSRGRILNRLPLIVEITRRASNEWQPKQSIVLFPWLQNVVAEQLGQLLTHFGPGDAVPALDTFLSTMLAATMSGSQTREVLQSPSFLQARQRVFSLGRDIVAAHRTPSAAEQEPDLVDDMLMRNTNQVATNEQMALGALGPFLAGLHTVTNAACFLLYALLKNPDAYVRVMKEIDEIFVHDDISWDALKNMHALHGAMMEGLRLYPVSIGHRCQAMQAFTFNGYRVEKGESVFVAMTVSHFLPGLFPGPMSFDIDRYTEPRNEHRQHGAYAPFGLGDHSCLGAGIAEIQLMVTVVTLLSRYRLELDPPEYEIQPLGSSRATVRDNFRVRIVGLR